MRLTVMWTGSWSCAQERCGCSLSLTWAWLSRDNKGKGDMVCKMIGKMRRVRIWGWFCYNYGEFVDESQKNVYGLTHIGVVPPAEECSCKMVSLVKVCTYGMGQQCFSNSRWAIDPVHITLGTILLPWFLGYPIHDVIEDGLAGAVHTAEVTVIASLDRLKPLKQKLLLCLLLLCLLLLCLLLLCLLLLSFHLLCTKPLRINYWQIENWELTTDVIGEAEGLNAHCTVEIINHLS